MTTEPTNAVTVGAIIAELERRYPSSLAEDWDAIGLVCGDPDDQVHNVLCCVDPVESTVDEALSIGAQLIVAHHPLLLRGVHGVPANDPKGNLVHRLIRSGVALFCAHTNADSANPGVSDALAEAIGLRVLRPLNPHEPNGETGIGRIGELPKAEPLAAFVQRVANALQATAWGVRAAGNPDRLISTVAVSGGSGDSYLAKAAENKVDAYVTADLRHHPAGEHLARGSEFPALVDVAHWASEWPWCNQAADVIRSAFAGKVNVTVSSCRTDPWTLHAHTMESE